MVTTFLDRQLVYKKRLLIIRYPLKPLGRYYNINYLNFLILIEYLLY